MRYVGGLALALAFIIFTIIWHAWPTQGDTVSQQRATWASLRNNVAPPVPVLVPTWLPPRFDTARTASIASMGTNIMQTRYSVSYIVDGTTGSDASLVFTLDAANPPAASRGESSDRVLSAHMGTLGNVQVLVQAPEPAFTTRWRAAGRFYSLQASHVSLSDILTIVARIRPL